MPTALIVEDEPEANKLLAMLVQFRGYRTDSAFNGREALAKVDREPPDIVFLDLMLPDVNGYEVCKALKGRKSTALIPVVMVTARVAAENRLRSYAIGADRYIAKPYTPDQIYEALDEADSWRLGDNGGGPHCRITFGSADDGETLRRLARLRSQCLARTPLDAESAAALGEALQVFWESADSWGRKHGVGAVATLRVHTSAEGIELTLRDDPGSDWLASAPGDPADRWPGALDRARFDVVRVDPGDQSITFLKRFARDRAGPGLP
jgi:CheY-like chemotaxis protein